MIVLALMGIAAVPVLLLTALVERINQEARPTGCPSGCRCRGR